MAGIHVLSDTLKGVNKLEKTLAPKGKDVPDSPGNTTVVFAALLSGSMNPNVDPKGQNSSIVGQDSEEKQSADTSVQSIQNPDGLGSMLGYGNFALAILTQPMLQSDLPAGKDANSGKDVSQGTSTGNNPSLVTLSNISLASDEVFTGTGMTPQKPQGDNPGITELDKYRQVIADLLAALSGEITDLSPKGTPLGSESAGTKDLSQNMAKIIQGWMMATDDVAKDGQAISGQAMDLLEALSGKAGVTGESITTGQRTANPELNAKASTLLAALYPLLTQGAEDAKTSQGVKETFQAEVDLMAKGSLERSIKQLKEIVLDPVVTQVKDSALLTKVQQNADGIGPRSTQTDELSGVKDVQNQNSSAGVGVTSNIVAANVADGKTVAIPVWKQISTVLHEQVMNRHQALKELDIQLHPADLGKIQIAMRWENGQVHLQVHASEAATGQILQNQLSDLRQALASQGVNCGMLQMGQGGERQQNPSGDEPQRTFYQNTQPTEDEDLSAVINPLSLGQNEINRINVTA